MEWEWLKTGIGLLKDLLNFLTQESKTSDVMKKQKLMDKIDEKIEELKNIKKMNKGTVENVKNNISLMMSNLYYRMKLMADFIRSEFK